MWIKTKRSFCILLAVMGLLLLVYFLHDGEVAPVIHTIVIATKTKIHGAAVDNEDDTSASVQKYLDMLGFGNQKSSLFRAVGRQQPLVIATVALSRYYEQTFKFVKHFGGAFLNASIVIFNLDLWYNDAAKLDEYCNTTAHCTVRTFELSSFPSHVRDLTTRAYKPILLQALLAEFCTVVWVDSNSPLLIPTTRFVSFVNEMTCLKAHEKSADVRRRRRESEKRTRRQAPDRDAGLLGWSISLPTSALTQTGTFERLGEQAEHYYFSRMLSTSHLLLYRRDCCSSAPREEEDSLHRSMLDWCRCVLDSRCLSPTGSQSAQCNLARVPSFKFTGCHLFEMSALNVVLGTQYHYDELPYSLDSRFSIFDAFNSTVKRLKTVRNLGSQSSTSRDGRPISADTQSSSEQVSELAESNSATGSRSETTVSKSKPAGFTLPFFDSYANDIRWFGESRSERSEELEQESTF